MKGRFWHIPVSRIPIAEVDAAQGLELHWPSLHQPASTQELLHPALLPACPYGYLPYLRLVWFGFFSFKLKRQRWPRRVAPLKVHSTACSTQFTKRKEKVVFIFECEWSHSKNYIKGHASFAGDTRAGPSFGFLFKLCFTYSFWTGSLITDAGIFSFPSPRSWRKASFHPCFHLLIDTMI